MKNEMSFKVYKKFYAFWKKQSKDFIMCQQAEFVCLWIEICPTLKMQSIIYFKGFMSANILLDIDLLVQPMVGLTIFWAKLWCQGLFKLLPQSL